ncbi:hypothetical protein [Enterococcus sp. CSURQ0835]|uniref:hypothetical protein n=1 Tax=Enterococcus sp. CSURQ0835 TaxID=2681394 RepID=UPI001358B145|nr:hypothetical protein [Enterococcus sp. CSURQ0835]
MLRFLKAEWLKTKRTWVPLLLIVLPLLYSGLFSWYVQATQGKALLTPISYQAFLFLLLLACQFMSGILIGLVTETERQAGNFINDLTMGFTRNQVWRNQMVLYFSWLVLVFSLAIGSFWWLSRGPFTGKMLLTSGVVCGLTALILPLHYMLALKFQLAGPIFFSLFWLILSSVGGEFNLLGPFWQFLPPVYPTKLLVTGGPLGWYLFLGVCAGALFYFVGQFWYNRFNPANTKEE